MKKIINGTINVVSLFIPVFTLGIFWLNNQIDLLITYSSIWDKYILCWLLAFVIYSLFLIFLLICKSKFTYRFNIAGLAMFIVPIVVLALNQRLYFIFLDKFPSNLVMFVSLLIIYLFIFLSIRKDKYYALKDGK